ncbi:MAG: hypothetical protein CMA77_03465 [Euryarchaeota archaeon]|nr:hypothetical protein [Euryarchaeota archaeon]
MHNLFAVAYGIAFVVIGISHFTEPQKFVEIVPKILPYSLFLVYLTGVMEIAGGIAIIYPETRMMAGRLLAIFLIAVYPANLYMWTNDVAFNGTKLDTQGHVIRLVIQLLLIIIALYLSGDLNFNKSSN